LKKKIPTHAKLFIDVSFSENLIKHFYKQNTFDNKGQRVVVEETINLTFESFDKTQYLYEKNKQELQILNNYIKTQKRVLEKHQKARNYDACNIVKNSLDVIFDFKKDFNIWFKKNEK